MKKILYVIIAIIVTSCIGETALPPTAHKDSTDIRTTTAAYLSDTISDSILLMPSTHQADSLLFRLTHHYSENFNFLVKADSLTLVPREGDMMHDTCKVYHGDVIVVAAIKPLAGGDIDSIWVKVASNQHTMGWILEQELLQGTTPDDPISEMLDALTGSRAIWMTSIILIGIIAIAFSKRKNLRKSLLPSFFNEMDSPYPSFFLILTTIIAALYASIQNFVPEFWQEYYFHPTLNPLVLPPLMATLVVMAWLLIITLIAVIDEIYHHFYFMAGITYLAKLLGLAMMVYLFVSWTTIIYIGYAILLILLPLLGKQMLHRIKDIKH
ncbi:MAG: hypothetical protein IKD25_07390 [Bacteroidaceae bacterium]|nr:hypothetical protein [Bacteroidaceae bacterium]